MIARTWKGATKAQDAEAYLEYLHRTGLTEYRKTPGNRGVLGLRRIVKDRAEFLLISLWDSKEAIRQFAGDDIEQAVEVVQRIARRLSTGDRAKEPLQHRPHSQPIPIGRFGLPWPGARLCPESARRLGRDEPRTFGPLDQPAEIGEPILLPPAAGPVDGVHQIDGRIAADELEVEVG